MDSQNPKSQRPPLYRPSSPALLPPLLPALLPPALPPPPMDIAVSFSFTQLMLHSSRSGGAPTDSQLLHFLCLLINKFRQ